MSIRKKKGDLLIEEDYEMTSPRAPPTTTLSERFVASTKLTASNISNATTRAASNISEATVRGFLSASDATREAGTVMKEKTIVAGHAVAQRSAAASDAVGEVFAKKYGSKFHLN